MKIAILGATSLIAKDLILALTDDPTIFLSLFARNPEPVLEWLKQNGKSINIETAGFEQFTCEKNFDAVINFVGAGDPVKIEKMGVDILNVSFEYDSMVLNYLQNHPNCKYIYLSSGAAYGDSFSSPVDYNSTATISINHLSPQDWYGAAKLHAECRHRAHPGFAITDIRIFNYISSTQDISSRSLISDIFRAIRDQEILITSPDVVIRDFLHPDDFHQLITAILAAPNQNTVVDCYTLRPVEKFELLDVMAGRFGLRYEVTKATNHIVNATGQKNHYYSNNRSAEKFGYFPSLSAIEGICQVADALFNQTKP